MVKKSKSKEPKPETPNPSPPDNNIFKTLFSTNALQEPNDPSSVSIFSHSNPFRTKPTNNIPQNNNTQITNSVKKPLSNKKDNNLPKNIETEDSVFDPDIKKLEIQNGFGSEGLKSLKSVKSLRLDEGDESKKRKKRKKGEVEVEYEERNYGGVELELKKDEGVKVKVEKVVVKEGFDDEEKMSRTVFVGNLPLKVKKKALLKEFSQFGEIESIRIRSIPLLDDKTPRKGAVIKKKINDAVDRVNAYIVFKTEDSAQASLSHNMAVVGGNHIHVDRACPPRKKLKGENAPLYDSKRTVFIGNLPFDVKDEELYQLFTGFNNLKDCIEAIRVVRDPGTSMGKGIAYVLFSTREAANTVVRKHKLKIRDRELRLSHATKASASTPSKRNESSSADSHNPSKKAAVGGSTSYQGIRATKSGGQKKFATRIAKTGRTESRSEHVVKRKVRSEKRPAVAARKAAANALKTGGDGGGGGMKRKAKPESNNRNKKPRQFR